MKIAPDFQIGVIRGSSPEKDPMSVFNSIKLEFQLNIDTPENKELEL